MVTNVTVGVLAAAVVSLISPSHSKQLPDFTKVRWDVGMLQWPEKYLKTALANGRFSPENTVIWNAEIWHDRAFLCLPRWSEGVVATLVSANWSTLAFSSPPTLHPFPNWAMQTPGDDCSGFSSVTAAVVDITGRLWVLDAGDAEADCPPKFVVFHLVPGGFSGKEVARHAVRIPGVSGKGLLYMAVDWGAGTGPRAYVSDPGGGSLLVYSLNENACWRAEARVGSGVGDIAISFCCSLLYFTPKEDPKKLYQIDLKALRDPPPFLNVSTEVPVAFVGKLLGPSSGLAADNKGGLLYFLRNYHAILRWDSNGPVEAEWHQVLVLDAEALPKVPRIIFDSQSTAWALANGFPKESNVSAMFMKVYDAAK